MRDHPHRAQLYDELHARPPLRLSRPAALTHQVFLAPESEAEIDRARVAELAQRYGQPGPVMPARHLVLTLPGGVLLRWERHGEFQAFTAIRPRAPEAHEDPWSALTPEILAFLETLPGERLVAVHVRIDSGSSPPAASDFGPELVGSSFGGSDARGFTDFRLHEGFGRILLQVGEILPDRLGRMAQRFLEIETYRMGALLALPEARATVSALAKSESRLTVIVDATANGREDDTVLLETLTTLAAEAEARATRTRFRFAAAAAYGALVESRMQGLGEAPLPGFQPWSSFLERRFKPALDTCASAARRQEAQLRDIANASSMLRTRVDVRLEQQNAVLLSGLDKRAAVQLRLSQAVEGFSVFAIAYYLVSLLKIGAEGLTAFGLVDAPRWFGLVAVPAVGFAVWFAVQRLRRSLHNEDG